MTECPYCGKEVSEGERYCNHCDNDISKTIDEEEAGNCFIATAAYGTPFAEEINILRSFRDKRLNNNPLGYKFVKFYYKISPGIANVISKNEFLKKIVRIALKPIIEIVKKIN